MELQLFEERTMKFFSKFTKDNQATLSKRLKICEQDKYKPKFNNQTSVNQDKEKILKETELRKDTLLSKEQ